MTKLYTFLFVITSFLSAQSQNTNETDSKIGAGITSHSSSSTSFQFRCHSATSLNAIPLYVIDGILVDGIAGVSPDEIESIDILKGAMGTSLYGCRAMPGVIIITTKSAKQKEFVIKDFLDGKAIEGATVTLIPSVTKCDTIHLIASDKGSIVTDKIKPGIPYTITVTSVGYKKFSTVGPIYKKVNQIMLEREVILLDEVIVSSSCCITRCTRSCRVYKIMDECTLITTTISKNITATEKSMSTSFTLYPNPVGKGNYFRIEFNATEQKQTTIIITDASGRQLQKETIQTVKGWNKFNIKTDSRWAAGIYFISLLDDQKQLVKTEQIVIQ